MTTGTVVQCWYTGAVYRTWDPTCWMIVGEYMEDTCEVPYRHSGERAHTVCTHVATISTERDVLLTPILEFELDFDAMKY
jgi:hypothetical protein